MDQQTPTPEPRFIVTSNDDEIKRGLENFGLDISQNPDKYLPIISSIGTMALLDEDRSVADYEIDGDTASKVHHYFRYDHDYDVNYDPATEAALKVDESHLALVALRARVDRREEPEKAAVLSEQIRRRRLAFFVERLIAYRNETNDSLPSAG